MRSEGYSSRSVCLSVRDYSRTTDYKAAYERYQQLQCYIQEQENESGDFAETTAFERYGVKNKLKKQHFSGFYYGAVTQHS